MTGNDRQMAAVITAVSAQYARSGVTLRTADWALFKRIVCEAFKTPDSTNDVDPCVSQLCSLTIGEMKNMHLCTAVDVARCRSAM